MIRQLVLITALWLGSAVAAQETEPLSIAERWNTERSAPIPAADVALTDLEWIARPVIVFADSPNDPRFRQQLDLLAERPEDLADRDVIILTDTDPAARGPWRTQLRPRGFMLVIMGKDGQVELRKPAPWDVREISRTIDKMPLRQQEIEDRRGTQ